MAARPTGYGLTAETKSKIYSKYDREREIQAREWMEAVVGEKLTDPTIGLASLRRSLKDGRFLVKLANAIIFTTGEAPIKMNTSTIIFAQMENIGNFLSFCYNYGVPKEDLFQTAELHEGTNMVQVIDGIHALGRKAQAKYFPGPILGPKEAAAIVN